MFYKNARIFGSDFRFHLGAFEVVDGRFGAVLPENVPEDAIDPIIMNLNLNELMTAWTLSGTGTLTDLQPYTHYSLIFFGTTDVAEVTNATLAGTVTLPVPTP